MKLTVEDLKIINTRLIEVFSEKEMTGVKDFGLLDSALNRPFQTFQGEDLYSNVVEKATALFESLSKNHPFQNGNKRSALASLIIFLDINDLSFVMPNENAADLVVDFVVGKINFEDVVELISLNILPAKSIGGTLDVLLDRTIKSYSEAFEDLVQR